jgi:hypothetical protein
MADDSKLNELEPYLPSSSEKKQAVLMYMVAWLILSMWKREVSPFTHHHIKQSLGWLFSVILTIFADFIFFMIWVLFAAISWLLFWFFAWVALLITLPVLAVGFMCMYQATKWKYIWESEYTNKFFALFSGMGNWVLNLFDANHYQIIDWERYRAEDQYYFNKKEEKTDTTQTDQPATQNINDLNSQNQTANATTSDWKTLDNHQQNVINNQSIWIDLSGHEINKPENQINN